VALEDSLCHYTTTEAAFEHILPTRELRISPYRLMADPLENQDLPFRATANDHAAEERAREIIDLVKRVRDATRLLSLTVDASEGYAPEDRPFMFGWTRARLWEHRAARHAGVCLVFDREEAIGRLGAEMNQLGMFQMGPVRYSPRGFSSTPASTLVVDEFDGNRGVARFVVDHEHDIFYSKTLDWASEHEFRFTLMPNEEHDRGDYYVFVPYGSSLRAVILGEKFLAWQIPAAKNICDLHGDLELMWLQWKVGLPWPMPATG
jgi:hypothetical protein